MPDNTDPETRSRVMSRIRGRNTRPEIAIRKRLFAMGFRYRLHARHLPGKPDIVFPGRKAAVFVNGCFWHHHDCHLFRLPGTRRQWWKTKLEGNRQRDRANRKDLMDRGWRVMVLWECAWRGRDREMKLDRVAWEVARWLESDEPFREIRGEDGKTD